MEDLIVLLTPKFFIFFVCVVLLFILILLNKTTVKEVFNFFLELIRTKFGGGSNNTKDPS